MKLNKEKQMFEPGDVIRYNHPKYPEWKKCLLVVLEYTPGNNSIFCVSLFNNNFMLKGKKAVFMGDGYFEKVEIEAMGLP